MLPEYEPPEVLVGRNRGRGYQDCRVRLRPGPSQGPAFLLFENFAIKTRLFYSITMARHWEKAENREKASCPRATIVAPGIGLWQDCGSTVGRRLVEMEAPPTPTSLPWRPLLPAALSSSQVEGSACCHWGLLWMVSPSCQDSQAPGPLFSTLYRVVGTSAPTAAALGGAVRPGSPFLLVSPHLAKLSPLEPLSWALSHRQAAECWPRTHRPPDVLLKHSSLSPLSHGDLAPLYPPHVTPHAPSASCLI